MRVNQKVTVDAGRCLEIFALIDGQIVHLLRMAEYFRNVGAWIDPADSVLGLLGAAL